MEHIKILSLGTESLGRMSLILIFSFLLAQGLVVFAEDNDFCSQVKNISCDNLESLNEFSSQAKKIKKDCGDSALSSFQAKINECKMRLEKEKRETGNELENIKNQEYSAEKTLKNIKFDIKELNTSIASLNLSVSQLEGAIEEKEKIIIELEKALESQKKLLAEILQQFYEYDAASSIEILLAHRSLSDFGDKLEETARLQINLKLSMEEIKNVQKQMEDQKTELEKDKEEKLQNKKAQEISRQSLTARKEQQKYLLGKLTEAKTPLEKEMAKIETELMEMRNAMSRIQSYLGGWLINGAPTWSQIISVVSSASQKTGVDIFTMLGVLQIESTFQPTAGKNMGSPEGNLKRCEEYRKDDSLCYREKPVFEEICGELGLNPNVVPISYAYAMGPAQFIPTTWRAYQKKDITIKNPWRLNDAVFAMAYKLAAGGVAGYNSGLSTYAYRVNSAAAVWKEVYNTCGSFDLNCSDLRNRLEKMGIPTQ